MRYLNQYQDVGHVQPKMAIGNHTAEREAVGQAPVHLALFRCVRLEASIDHVGVFRFKMDLIVLPYSPLQIVRAK